MTKTQEAVTDIGKLLKVSKEHPLYPRLKELANMAISDVFVGLHLKSEVNSKGEFEIRFVQGVITYEKTPEYKLISCNILGRKTIKGGAQQRGIKDRKRGQDY